MARLRGWAGLLFFPALADEAVQTSSRAAPQGLSWGEATLILGIVLVVMAGLVLFGWLERR
jgi:hypothetical protein